MSRSVTQTSRPSIVAARRGRATRVSWGCSVLTASEWAAPCSNGTVAYVSGGALFVMRADGSHVRRLVRQGVSTPDCSPKSRAVIDDASHAREPPATAQGGGTHATVR